MRKFILSSLELTSNIAIIVILLFGLFTGATWLSGNPFGALIGATLGLLIALVVCVLIFGVIFLLMEIAENTRRTAAAVDASRSSRTD